MDTVSTRSVSLRVSPFSALRPQVPGGSEERRGSLPTQFKAHSLHPYFPVQACSSHQLGGRTVTCPSRGHQHAAFPPQDSSPFSRLGNRGSERLNWTKAISAQSQIMITPPPLPPVFRGTLLSQAGYMVPTVCVEDQTCSFKTQT